MNDFKKLSLIISVYNEEEVLDQFYLAAMEVLEKLDCDYELIFSNDGSRDMSPVILDRLAEQNKKVKVIHFSRNYGHEAAMIAGLDYCTGDGAICMDADLQHPVECIPEIIKKFREGYDVITMIRTSNQQVPIWKKVTSGAFYKLLNQISDTHFDDNASDFFAVSRQPLNVLKTHFREKNRFLRAYVQNVGFNKTSLEYEAKDRAAGQSKYNFKSLFKFSVTALLSFSNLPLRIATGCAAVTGVCSLLSLVLMLVRGISGMQVSGLWILGEIIGILFTVLFALLGIMGEYIAILLSEIRERPVYLVKAVRNFESIENGNNQSKGDNI